MSRSTSRVRFTAALLLSLLTAGAALAQASPLEQGFATPPDAAKPWVFWWWLNGNASREGITRDLEEMKRKGISGVLLFSAGGGPGAPHGPEFLSAEWRGMYRHALREAERLGITVSVSLCDGWCAGGPWIKPEEANRKIVYSEVQLAGGASGPHALPMPPVIDGFYRDVAVLAVRERATRPLTPAGVTASSSTEGYCGEWNLPPEEAADGDPETYWAAGGGSPGAGRPAWLTLRYHEPLAATSAYIAATPESGPRECELQASSDGQTYATLAGFTLGKGEARRVDFAETRAREFRLLIRSAYAAPVQVAEFSVLRAGDEPLLRPGLKWWLFKSGNRSFWDYPRQGPAALAEEYPEDGVEPDCRTEDVVDLTGQTDASGTLTWDPPAGRWTVLRFGYTVVGQRTRCSGTSNIGYEADMLSAAGIESQFRNTAVPLLAEARAAGCKGPEYVHTDSYEVGADVRGQQPTWGDDFLGEFARRRGYDPLPYFPVLTRRVVESREVSDRFLADIRWTIGDLIAERFFGRLHELAREAGVRSHSETGYGTYPFPHIDGLRAGAQGDVAMGEFWYGTDIMSQFSHWANVIRTVSSAANTYGRQIVQAESFTAWSHWQESPAMLKPVGDQAFCDGLNRMVLHQYTQQAELEMKPGWQYNAGTHFDRNLTWWEQADAFFGYLGRCQYLLQQGKHAADVCYLQGEGVSRFVPSRQYMRPELPLGYDCDAVNAEVLLRDASVRDGRIVLASGVSYRLLALPEDGVMSARLLARVRDLVEAGATVVGPRPRKSPGLTGYPASDQETRRIASGMWTGGSAGERQVGRGRVIWGRPLARVLDQMGLAPDFAYPAAERPTAGLEGASWVWHAADGADAPECERLLRLEVSLPAGRRVLAAPITISVDNTYTLTVNGKDVCSGDNFTRPADADLAGLLRPGANTLLVRAANVAPGPAGLIARLEVRFDAGEPLVIATGVAPWESSESGEAWAPAATLSPYGAGPWGRPAGADLSRRLDYIHRGLAGAEVYFVSNRTEQWERDVACAFRVTGRQPEIWDAVSGVARDATGFAQAGGRTTVPLTLAPGGSAFVVFRRPVTADGHVASGNAPALTEAHQLDGPWEVRFDPKWGGPASVTFDRLLNWTKRPEEGIRYYSGTATYVRSFDLPPALRGRRVYLDLGRVRDVATVRLNGRDLGDLWTPPFRVELSGALRPTGNVLEVDVANLWPNRLIGDTRLPAEQHLARTNMTVYGQDSPLLESGLLGPVTLQVEGPPSGGAEQGGPTARSVGP